MQVLQCTRQSTAYHEQALMHYASEHAYAYSNYNTRDYNHIFSIRSNPSNYIINMDANVEYMDWRNAKRLTEIRYCMNLKSMCAKRTIKHRGQVLDLIASFDGLENGAEGGMVWVHIPYTKVNSEFIRTLGWSEFLDYEVRSYLEHQMLVAGSSEAMVTCSDGTFAHSINNEYESNADLRDRLLSSYAVFECNLRTFRNGITTQNGIK